MTASQKPSDPAGRGRCASSEPAANHTPIVCIGSAAGGLAPLQAFLRALGTDSGMAFVVLSHANPSEHSPLTDLLAKVAPIAVQDAIGDVDLEPNHVYVCPLGANAQLRRSASGVQITVSPRDRDDADALEPNCIDRLFTSATSCLQELAAGVVLSGSGCDGTAGALALRVGSGIVLVQEPTCAEFASMPASAIDAGAADEVLPAERMPEALARHFPRFLAADVSERPLEDEERSERRSFEAIREKLRRETPYDPSCYRSATLARRVARRMSLHRLRLFADYEALLHSSPEELAALFADLLIGVTAFFREPEAFEALDREVLSRLVQKTQPHGQIRIWVPGCASGEETYSIAIRLLELLDGEDREAEIHIFATDIDAAAVERARLGVYPPETLAGVPESLRSAYFTKEKEGFRIVRRVRECVVFAVQNILADPPFTHLDLVSCRNVLIYLDTPIQRRIIALFHYALSDGGCLFLGSSETIGQNDDLFEPLSKKWRIYRHLPSRRARLDVPIAFSGGPRRRARSLGASLQGLQERESFAGLTEAMLLGEYAPPAVLIDRKQQVVYFHGAVERYLRLPAGDPSLKLPDLGREGLATRLRGAVSRAIREARRVEVIANRVRRDGAHHRVRLTVVPADSGAEVNRLWLVVFEDADERTSDAEERPSTSEDEGLAWNLEHELQVTREDLQTTIEALEASNEEVSSTNEELQSSNEELETSQEELQSLNEELSTANTQLQENIDALERTNNDLTNLLNGIDTAVLFLDPEFRIRRFTPAAGSLFDLISGDIGRPISHLASHFSDQSLLGDARRVLDTLESVSKKVATRTGRVFLRRVLCYRTATDRIDGVVVIFTEVTDLERAVSELGRIDWMLTKRLSEPASAHERYGQPYGDLSQLGTSNVLRQAVGDRKLEELAVDLLDLMDSSSAIYEANGDYAVGLFSSGWCRRLDARSRELCDTLDNREALHSGRWHCHESCWTEVSKRSVELNDVVDVECAGGLRICAAPIRAGGEVVGSINFGYGDPPSDPDRLRTLAERFELSIEELQAWAAEHEHKPAYVVSLARRRLLFTARLIGEIVERKRAVDELHEYQEQLEEQVALRTDELQRTREQVQRSERLASIGTLAAGIAHELNNPLGMMRLAVESALEEPGIETPRAALQHVREGVARCALIVKSVLRFARDQKADRVAVDLNDCASRSRDMVSGFAREHSVSIRMQFEENLPSVDGNPTELEQVLVNLLRNGVQAGEAGSEVTICTASEGRHVSCSVEDRGRGMSDEECAHAFDPFYTTHRREGGTGLGLSVSHGIIREHGGTLRIEGNQSGGCTARFELPARADPSS